MPTELQTALLEWSANLPIWQRDLLRRLSQGETLTADEIRAYANHLRFLGVTQNSLLIGEHDWEDDLELVPLTAEHLNVVAADEAEVRITKLLHIAGANALAPGAQLDLEPAGLTIIAGRNGTGKSGYTRILKQVCASRAPEVVLENAYSPGTVPSAVISYTRGDEAGTDVTWSRDAPPLVSPLQRVRVFDKHVAEAHLTGPAQIAYIPPVLQILSGLTIALRQIKDELQRDSEIMALSARSWPELEAGEVGATLALLGTGEAKIKLDELVALTEAERASVTTLPAEIAAMSGSDPARQVVLAKHRAQQLSNLAGQLGTAGSVLVEETITALGRERSALTAANNKLAALREELFADERLSETGSQTWQTMWRSAKAFLDEHAHEQAEDASGPVDFGHPSLCPLCQQDVDELAASRFSRFHLFMNGEAEADVSAAQAALSARISQINSIEILEVSDGTLASFIEPHDEIAAARLSMTVDEARSNIAAIVSDEALDPPAEGFDIGQRLTALAAVISQAAAAEESSVERLSDADSNAAEVARRTDLLDAIELRIGLETRIATVQAEHDRRVLDGVLSAAMTACDTTAASRKNGTLSQEYVAKVGQAFADEALVLGLTRAPVKLVFARSQNGVSYIKVVLEGAETLALSTVLSDGEQRMVAIAGFFADLTESGDSSTLVFDDPVSSLDQEYRQAVARRLIEEAAIRQVLVFTHDEIFVRYLYESKANLELVRVASADDRPVAALEYLHLTRTARGSGSPTTNEAWRHVAVKDRIARLNERIQVAAALYRAGDEVQYELMAKDIIGGIRETWERLVEQVLLKGVVQRFERDIRTRELRYLTDIDDQDVARIDLGMNVESRFMTGHDDPTGDVVRMSGPDWLSSELNNLKEFSAEINRRRQNR
jgi:ABC-type hemin transport system ATPase subunit